MDELLVQLRPTRANISPGAWTDFGAGGDQGGEGAILLRFDFPFNLSLTYSCQNCVDNLPELTVSYNDTQQSCSPGDYSFSNLYAIQFLYNVPKGVIMHLSWMASWADRPEESGGSSAP